MGFVFNACSWLAGWLTIGVLVLSLSAGLYLACDLAEEYASICKKYLHRGILSITTLYIIFAIDGLPWFNSLIGIASHLSLLPLLSTYPIVEIFSISTIWSVIVTILNHLNWFYYFLDVVGKGHLPEYSGMDLSGMKIIGFFFVFVWTIPLGFFISLTSADECLPTSGIGGGGSIGSSSGGASHMSQDPYNQQYNDTQYNDTQYGGINGSGSSGGNKKPKGIFKSFVDSILNKKDELYPGIQKRNY